MNDKVFTAQIRRDIDKGFKDGFLDPEDHKYLYNNNKMPKTCVQKEDDFYTIIDDDQEVRIVTNGIIYMLAKELSNKTGYHIDTGDGDEGSIYPEELLDNFEFYCFYKKEIKED